MRLDDVRYTDLFPDVPMARDQNCVEVYVDNIADITVHGVNFTTTYFVWAYNGAAGLLHRVPVVKIIRPRSSVLKHMQRIVGGGPELISH